MGDTMSNMKFKKLSDTSKRCQEIVKAYLKVKFDVELTDEQLFKVYSDEQDIWHLVEKVKAEPEEVTSKSLGIKASGVVHHVFYSRVTGELAPHVLTKENLDELHKHLMKDEWEDNLKSYVEVIQKIYREAR